MIEPGAITEPVIWRGIPFVRSPESHKGYERWDSEAQGPYGRPLWAAERFPPSEEWFARLLVHVHRFTGKGPNMHLALDAALEEAKKARRAMSQAMPEMKAEARVRELEQKLAEAERAMHEANRVSENAIRSRDAAEARVRELEEKLAAAELDREESERLLEVKMRERDVAEARVRELEADIERYSHGKLATRCDAAESELAQLRERVASLPRWSPCLAEPEEDDDGPLYQGFLTDPAGTWVRWEDLQEEALRGPK